MLYKQTREVSWLKTPKDTLWRCTTTFGTYIQPLDKNLIETPFGVNLDLLDCTEDEDLFEFLDPKSWSISKLGDSGYELNFCPICLQMTNHIENVCQKCKDSGDRCVF